MRGQALGRARRQERRPRIPARFAQTYTMLAPAGTHRRRASCAEADCPNLSRARCEAVGCTKYDSGWKTLLHTRQADLLHLARTSGRQFIEKPPDGGGVVEFIFLPGQQCFESPHWAADVGRCEVVHTVSLDRPGIYRVRGGRSVDFGEGRSDLWAEHFQEHTERVGWVMNR